MTATNEALVASGLRALREPLSIFVCQGIADKFGEEWWIEGVLEVFVHDRTPTIEDVRKHRKLPESGTTDELASTLDINGCLILLTKHWARIFGPVLGQDHRGWAYELMGVRNKNKHLGSDDHPSDYAWRALDTMYRLCNSIDTDTAGQLLALRSSVDLSEFRPASPRPGRTVAPGAQSGDELPAPTEAPEPFAEVPSEADDLEADLAVVGPDFAGADLRKMNFAGANLEGADFTDADLREANLTDANLTRAVFTKADLGAAYLMRANLTDAIFNGTTLYTPFGPATGANFEGATLDGATIRLAGMDLRKVRFAGANLEGADFTDADLREANLTDATLRGVNLKGANIKDAYTQGVIWT